MLGLTLHLGERIARHEKIRDHHVAGMRCLGEITVIACGLKCHDAADRGQPGHVCPGQYQMSKNQISGGQEAFQPASFDQFITEPAKAISGLIVAEAGAGDHAKLCIGSTRGIAVALLKAEIDGPADGQGK